MDEKVAGFPHKKQSRIQIRNRKRIMDAALIVFSENGYRGATLDQIAIESGLSKPNILYYFEGKQNIHLALLSQLMAAWLAPLDAMNPNGEPLDELLGYMQRKLAMSREFPRESRLFAARHPKLDRSGKTGTSRSTASAFFDLGHNAALR
jgi:TetR/AcrR family transcriptional regulator